MAGLGVEVGCLERDVSRSRQTQLLLARNHAQRRAMPDPFGGFRGPTGATVPLAPRAGIPNRRHEACRLGTAP